MSKGKSITKGTSTEIDDFEPEAPEAAGIANFITEHESPAALVKEGFKAEVFGKLEPGQQLRGIFLGEGSQKPVKDANDPTKKRLCRTWRFQPTGVPGLIVTIMGGPAEGTQYDLNDKLQNIKPGTMVVIQKYEPEQINGRRINRHEVFPGTYMGEKAEVKGLLSAPATNGTQAHAS